MPEDSPGIPVRQVYVWLITSDQQMVIVSKDGANWQLPGGKPDAGENALQTVIREVFEETGIDLTSYKNRINFFGEYVLEDGATVVHPLRYRQVRSWVQIEETANALKLSVGGEAAGQSLEDVVRFVRTIPVKNVLEYIPWLKEADEYKALNSNPDIGRIIHL